MVPIMPIMPIVPRGMMGRVVVEVAG